MEGVIISSYKGHTIFGFLVSLLFSINPIFISLVLIGANFSDFDHKFRRNNILALMLFSLIVFVFLYLMKFSVYLGVLLFLLSFIFLISSHRGFSHSLFGAVTLSFILSLIFISGVNVLNLLFSYFGFYFNYSLVILIILFSLFVLNKRIFPIFIILFLFSLFLFSSFTFNFVFLFFSLFLGFFSHIILDLFSPSGVGVFTPFYSKIFHKNLALVFLLILLVFAFFNLIFGFNFSSLIFLSKHL